MPTTFTEYLNAPTEETSALWIYVSKNQAEATAPRVGKWMHFVEEEAVDAVWASIYQKFVNDELPSICAMKVATKLEADMHAIHSSAKTWKVTYMICFYVLDSLDLDLVQSAARELWKALNLKRGLLYKPDLNTRYKVEQVIYKFTVTNNNFKIFRLPALKTYQDLYRSIPG